MLHTAEDLRGKLPDLLKEKPSLKIFIFFFIIVNNYNNGIKMSVGG